MNRERFAEWLIKLDSCGGLPQGFKEYVRKGYYEKTKSRLPGRFFSRMEARQNGLSVVDNAVLDISIDFFTAYIKQQQGIIEEWGIFSVKKLN